MCNNCDDIVLRDSFYSSEDYLNCLKYIQELIDTRHFTLAEKTCDLDKVKDENIHWVDDIIGHVIQCQKCEKYFSCYSDTYHGRGSFRKGK